MRVGGSRPKTSSFRRLDCLFLKHIPSSEKRFIAFCQTSKECRLKILYICLQWVDDVALNVVGYISVSGNPENFWVEGTLMLAGTLIGLVCFVMHSFSFISSAVLKETSCHSSSSADSPAY
jgi:hypothetical protein